MWAPQWGVSDKGKDDEGKGENEGAGDDDGSLVDKLPHRQEPRR